MRRIAVLKFSFLFFFVFLSFKLSSQTTYYARQTGSWSNANTWSTNAALQCSGPAAASTPTAIDNVVICEGVAVTLAADVTINNLDVRAGAVLNCDASRLDINGNLIIDGTIVANPTGGRSVYFNGGVGKTMDGDGVIDVKNNGGRSFFVQGNASILATANYTIANDMTIQAGVTVTNYGNINIGIDLIGANATTSVWVNETNSSLTVRGVLLNNGVLTATASGNTIIYAGTANQNVKTPSGNTYFNLTSSNAATVTQLANLILGGSLSISSGTYTCSTFDLNISGNFINQGTFTYGTRTVTFDGSGDQFLENSSGQSLYNLVINKVSGVFNLRNNVIVRNTLTMSSGNINTGNYRLTLGYAETLVGQGTLAYSSGTIIGEYEKYFGATGATAANFPIGNLSFYRPANATFQITATGSVVTKFISNSPGNNGMPLVDGGVAWIYNTFNDGYWSLTAANGFTVSSYTLQLTGNGFSSFTVDSETRILTRQNSSSTWTARGNHSPAVGFTANRTGLTSFGGGILGEYCFGDDTNCAKPSTSVISGSNSVCMNIQDEIYSVTNTIGSIYNWGISPSAAGTVDPLTQGSSQIEIDWGSVGGDVRIFVVENNGCTTGDTVFYNVTIHAVPPSSIIGSLSVPVGAIGSAYSVIDLGYTYTWTITGGTTDPNPSSGQGTNSILVNWNNTEGNGQISVVATDLTCGSAAPITINVYKYTVINSIATGSWANIASWDCNCIPLATDNVRIRNGHTVTLSAATTINNVVVDAGATLNHSNRAFTINGDLILNGQITNSGGSLNLSGVGTYIDGTGIFANSVALTINTGNKIIASTAILTKNSSNISIAAGLTVTNYGSVSILSGTLATGGTWINKENSTLKVLTIPVSALQADALDNTVEYISTAGLTIKNTVGSSYYHLKLNGTSTLALPASLDINGNLTITNSSILNTAGFNLNIGGNFINSSSVADAFTESTGIVYFDGNTDQNISSNTIGGERFANLYIDKTLGQISGLSNIIVSNTLTMNSGNIDMGSNRIILGTAATAGNEGTLVYNSGTIIGEYQKWIRLTGTYLFPLGSLVNYCPANITLNNVAAVGSLISKFVPTNPGSNTLPLTEGSVQVTNQFTEGYWNFIASSGFSTNNFDLSLVGDGFLSYTINSATRIIKRTNGGDWQFDGIHANASGNTCYRNGLTGNIAINSTQFCLGHTDCATFNPPTITGNSNVCNGGTEVYSIPNSGNTYQWNITGGTTDPDPSIGQGTYQVTVTWGSPNVAANVQLIESKACYVAPASNLAVTVHTLPTSAIIGLIDVPENTNLGNYTVTARPGYTYTWSITSGNGSISSGQGTNSVMINWGAASAATIQVVGQYGTCAPAAAVTINVNVYSDIVTIANGDWGDAATWFGGNVPDLTTESAKVKHIVTINNGSYTIKNIYIENTGSITHAANRDLTIQGNYYNYGSHTATNNGADINLNAALTGTSIGGTGSISLGGSATFNIGTNERTVVAGTNLSLTGSINLSNGITVRNYGTISISGNLVGGNATSTWINDVNSRLNIGGTLLSTGTLTANASGNIVNYNGAGAQTLKLPSGNKYWHLYLSGGATKTNSSAEDIDGDVNIGGTAQLASSTFNINIGGNWSITSTNATPFTATTGIVNFDGVGNQNISSNTGLASFPFLTISSQGNISLIDCNLRITNTLNLTKGIISTGAYRVLISRNSVGASNAGNSTSFVDGIVRKQGNSNFTFPIGNSGTWAPLAVSSMVGGLATDVFDAQYFYTAAPNPSSLGPNIDHVSRIEYWDLTPITSSASQVDVAIYWKDANRSAITDITSGDLIMCHYNSASSLWESKGGTIWASSTIGPGGKGYIASTFTAFSPITFGSKFNTNPLPIELISFNAECGAKNEIYLNWATATETNNNYFLLERKTGLQDWQMINRIQGKGNSNVLSNYSFVDFSNQNELFYRLRSFDFDGREYSYQAIPVQCDVESTIKSSLDIIEIDNGILYLEFNNISDQLNAKLQLINSIGQTVESKSVEIIKGKQILNFPIPDYIGVCLLVLTNNEERFVKKVILK